MEQSDAAGEPAASAGKNASVTRTVAIALMIVVVGLVAWTGYLAWTLPQRYEARNWNLLWVGFDTALIAVLGYAAWAAWFQRRIMVVTALVAGTLLFCDAWFDVVTSVGNRDDWLTFLTAAGGELPAAIFFFWVAHRILTRLVLTVHELSGFAGPAPRIRDAGELHATGRHLESEPVAMAVASSDTADDTGA